MYRKLFDAKIPALLSILTVISLNGSAEAPAPDPIEACRLSASSAEEEIECLRDSIRSRRQEVQVPAPSIAPEKIVPDTIVPTVPETPSAPTGLGAEQVISRQVREGKVVDVPTLKDTENSFLVVDFARTERDQLVLVLDNGQVWVQRMGDAQTVSLQPGEPVSIRILRGALSGYRIWFEEARRTIIAERIK